MTFIYAIVDPDTDDIRYIGQTTKSLEERLCAHIKNATRGIKGHIYNWFRSKPIEPLIFAVEENPPDLDEAEIRWIAYFRATSPNLTNITDGGYGLNGFIHTEEQNRKIGEALKGGHPTDQARSNMSKGQMGNKNSLGYVPTEEKRRKISDGNKGKPGWNKGQGKGPGSGKPQSEDTKAKKRASLEAYWANVSEEERKERGRVCREGILNKRGLQNGAR